MVTGRQVSTRQWRALQPWERQLRRDRYRDTAEMADINSYCEQQAGVREETENSDILTGEFWDAYYAVPWWVRMLL